MQKFVEKMIVERNDLKGKIRKNEKVIDNPPFGSDEEGLRMLSKQLEAMKEYLHWLDLRIEKEGVKK
jgi:hypothetical protein